MSDEFPAHEVTDSGTMGPLLSTRGHAGRDRPNRPVVCTPPNPKDATNVNNKLSPSSLDHDDSRRGPSKKEKNCQLLLTVSPNQVEMRSWNTLRQLHSQWRNWRVHLSRPVGIYGKSRRR